MRTTHEDINPTYVRYHGTLDEDNSTVAIRH